MSATALPMPASAASSRAAIVAIVKKELREHARLIAVALMLNVVALASEAIVLSNEGLGVPEGTAAAIAQEIADGALMVSSVIALALLPASLFANESRAGTLARLLALPVSRTTIFAAKVLAGAAMALLIGTPSLLGLLGLLQPTATAVIVTYLVAAGGLLFSTSLLAGCYTSNALVGALVGMIVSWGVEMVALLPTFVGLWINFDRIANLKAPEPRDLAGSVYGSLLLFPISSVVLDAAFAALALWLAHRAFRRLELRAGA